MVNGYGSKRVNVPILVDEIKEVQPFTQTHIRKERGIRGNT